GVVDNNYFDVAYLPVRNYGNPVDGGLSYWNNHEGIVFGKADNNLWFEDNVFNIGTGGMLTDCVEALCYGFRYNTINVPINTYYQLFDMHGNNGSQYSCMGNEVYGNNIVGAGSGEFMDLRGGRMFAFYNNTATPSNWYYQLREERFDSDTP